MPIETALEQAVIENSLIDSSQDTHGSVSEIWNRIEADSEAEAAAGYPPDWDEARAEQESESQEFEQSEAQDEQGGWDEEAVDPGPDAREAVQEFLDEQRNEMALRLANEQVQQAPAPNPSAVLQEIDSIIEQADLATPERAEETTATFSAATGMPMEHINPESFNSVSVRSAISAVALYPSAMAATRPGEFPSVAVPLANARVFAKDLLGSFGEDSRLYSDEQQQALAQTTFDGDLNLIRTGEALGWPEDASQVNDARMAVHFAKLTAMSCMKELPFLSPQQQKEIYDNLPIDERAALNRADWRYHQVRSAHLAMSERQARQAEPRHRESQPASRRRAIPNMRTNQDLYDSEALEAYQLEHGRL